MFCCRRVWSCRDSQRGDDPAAHAAGVLPPRLADGLLLHLPLLPAGLRHVRGRPHAAGRRRDGAEQARGHQVLHLPSSSRPPPLGWAPRLWFLVIASFFVVTVVSHKCVNLSFCHLVTIPVKLLILCCLNDLKLKVLFVCKCKLNLNFNSIVIVPTLQDQ